MIALPCIDIVLSDKILLTRKGVPMDDTIKVIASIVAAFLGGGAFKSLVDWWINSRKRKNRDNFRKLFDDIHKVYSLLNTVKRETYAKRVVLIGARNGGGVPTVDSDLTSSIMYEVYDYPFKSIKDQWQDQLIEKEHLSILREMYLNGEIEIKVDELDEGNFQDALKSNDAVYVKKFLVTGTEEVLYYLSLHYDKDYNEYPDKAKNRNAVRSTLSKMERLLSESNIIK